jgi:uncharacterized protein YjiS (DUF1127 family)
MSIQHTSNVARRLGRLFNAHRLADELGRLSDHYLRDVGIERTNVSDAFDRSFVKDRLLEAGWRYSQRI